MEGNRTFSCPANTRAVKERKGDGSVEGKKKMMRKMAVLVCLFVMVCGCTQALRLRGPAIKMGDMVSVDYTCRVSSGEIAATTEAEIANNPDLAKAPMFALLREYGPVTLKAGQGDTGDPGVADSMETGVSERLSEEILGLRPGEHRELEVTAKVPPELTGVERYVHMSLVRRRQKERNLTPEEYQTITGKEAEVGQEFIEDPAVPGKVVSVNDSEVRIVFSAVPGGKVETPFGPGVVREKEERYEIELHPQVGTVIRTGPLVARISEADDDYFTVAYGHPVGGEALTCGFTVESVHASEEEKTARRNKDAADASGEATKVQ